MRILVVSAVSPFPPVGGGRTRTYHLVRALAARHEVVVAGFTFEGETYETPHWVEVLEVPWEPPPAYKHLHVPSPTAAVEAYRHLDEDVREPWFVSFYESAAMERALRDAEPYDVVVFEGTDMARFLDAVSSRAVKILDLMDLHSLMALRRRDAGTERARRQADVERTIRFEREVATRCDSCLAVSLEEADAARRILGITSPVVVPNGVDTKYFAPPAEEAAEQAAIVFTGTMSYPPNVEAMQHFVRDVFPLIKNEVEEAVLHVVGFNPSKDVLDLARSDVVVHGGVPDVRPWLHRAHVVVVPLLSGGGTRLKILEAAASGCAIVSTTLGAEGLGIQSGREALVADRPNDFAGAVVRGLREGALNRSLRVNARQWALSYDWETCGARLLEAIEELVPCR